MKTIKKGIHPMREAEATQFVIRDLRGIAPHAPWGTEKKRMLRDQSHNDAYQAVAGEMLTLADNILGNGVKARDFKRMMGCVKTKRDLFLLDELVQIEKDKDDQAASKELADTAIKSLKYYQNRFKRKIGWSLLVLAGATATGIATNFLIERHRGAGESLKTRAPEPQPPGAHRIVDQPPKLILPSIETRETPSVVTSPEPRTKTPIKPQPQEPVEIKPAVKKPEPEPEKPLPPPKPKTPPAKPKSKLKPANLQEYVDGSPASKRSDRKKILQKINRVYANMSEIPRRTRSEIVKDYAERYGFDHTLFNERCLQLDRDPMASVALLDIESDFGVHGGLGVQSSAGAKGIAQFKTSTGQEKLNKSLLELVEQGDFDTFSKLVTGPDEPTERDKWVREQWKNLDALYKKSVAAERETSSADDEAKKWDAESRTSEDPESANAKAEWRKAVDRREKAKRDREKALADFRTKSDTLYDPTNPDQAVWLMLTYVHEIGEIARPYLSRLDRLAVEAAFYNKGPKGLETRMLATPNPTWDKIKNDLPGQSRAQGDLVVEYVKMLEEIVPDVKKGI